MKLTKRSSGGPVEPEEDLTPKGKKPVVVYIMVLFIAAFLLMAWSFASHQRSNTEAIGQLQSSVTAMQGVQEREVSLREYELEASKRQHMAASRLYTLERLYRQENLESCRKVIDSMEEDNLVAGLNDTLTDSERELGLTVSSRDRYQQLREAVEAREAEAGQKGAEE